MITCFCDTGKPEPQIKWFKEGKNLADGPDFEISYKDGRVSLMIPESFPEDTGKYTCKATNIGGQASSTAELIVRGICCFLLFFLSFIVYANIHAEKRRSWTKVT